jgi:predicted TIM-barrel fold metal-dependent hydrolase
MPDRWLIGAQVRPANNFILSLVNREMPFPGAPEVVVFGTVHPDFDRWEDELDRLENAGVKGLNLHPNFQNLAFDDPRLFPIMEAIGSRFAFLCHVDCERPLEENPANPYKLAKLLSMFPAARVIAAHLGGYADGKVALDVLAGKDIWLDTSNTCRMGDEYTKAIIGKHPFEQLMFGTDYPLFDPAEEVVRHQKRFGFSDSKMQDLLNQADCLLTDQKIAGMAR